MTQPYQHDEDVSFEIEDLRLRLREIKETGPHYNARPGNDGGAGNTLEDLLGVEENNLQIADYGRFELKTQRKESGSLLTLFHIDPQPRRPTTIINTMVSKLGWRYNRTSPRAVLGTPLEERSFRATLRNSYSDRGLRVRVDRSEGQVVIDFAPDQVDARHADWLRDVEEALGEAVADLKPYWMIDELATKAKNKLEHTVYIVVETIGQRAAYNFVEAYLLADFSPNLLIDALETGRVYIDFDARTGHNHGTKFRIARAALPSLFVHSERLI